MTGDLHASRRRRTRRMWPSGVRGLCSVLSQLATGYLGAGEPIARAGGPLDGIALGEWIHGGDIRDALGEPQAYASEGFDDACALLAERSSPPKYPAGRRPYRRPAAGSWRKDAGPADGDVAHGPLDAHAAGLRAARSICRL